MSVIAEVICIMERWNIRMVSRKNAGFFEKLEKYSKGQKIGTSSETSVAFFHPLLI